MKKIDFHIHITPPEISSDWRKFAEGEPFFEPHFALLSKSPQNKFACAEEIVSMLDASGFDQAVVFGFGFRDLGLCRMVNDYVIEKMRKFPDRIIGFMSVSPGAKGVEKEIARCYDEGLKGVGEVCPVGQGFAIEDANETKALVQACKEREIPLIIHVNEPVGHTYPGKTGTDLRKIEQFIDNSQGLRVVLSHLGGGLLFYESMPELRKKFCNVYYDTAAVPFLYDKGVYKAALALGLGEKIIFGSDFPLLHPFRYLASMEFMSLSENDKIMGGNAERLLVWD
ncbi:MAG: amidohydrolase family protein [Treponema sp.]|nr:amidohydrolase family protein [Treponema sp.]